MSGPRVTVVVPTYERSALVQVAVASVLDQTFEDHEIVVVVDGSTDGTAEALRARFDDPRLRVVEQENRGLAGARNTGLAHARGEYAALLDDDDRCLPERLERQVAALDAHPAAALCLSDARYEDGAGTAVGTLCGQPGYRSPDSLRAMFEGAWTLPSVMMLRTTAVRQVGFDAEVRYQEDTDFLFRFHRAGHRVISVPEVLVVYAVGAGGSGERISEQRGRMDEAYARIYTRHWDEVDPVQHVDVRRPARVERLLATYHLARGDHARARTHLFACWRARPWRIRSLLRGLQSLRAVR